MPQEKNSYSQVTLRKDKAKLIFFDVPRLSSEQATLNTLELKVYLKLPLVF